MATGVGAVVTTFTTTARVARLDHSDRLAAARRAKALDGFANVLATESELEIPAPVTEVVPREKGKAPKLPADAFELARQVYYLRHGTLRDAARAVVAEGLCETDNLDTIRDRLRTWWARERWPTRGTLATFAIRDASFDGGLFRSERTCRSLTTGNGAGPAGAPCGQSPLSDSEYCFQHDPRPEYQEARERTGRRLAASRQVDMVPIKPFADWCDATRRQMLEDARHRGEAVHHLATGWKMLATALRVDQSQLNRLVVTGVTSRGGSATRIKAKTVVRYLEPLEGVSFEDVYGFPPPMSAAQADACCPECGGPKNVASKVCRPCFDAIGSQCQYRNRRGDQCTVTTQHESGYCCKCRLIVFREPRPRTGRASFVSTPMLTLATEAYTETPKFAIVARRMWASNAAGVRDVFANCQSLTGSLVKQFSKRGWRSQEAVAAAHDDLVRDFGEVAWPEGDSQPFEVAGLLPAGPYVKWLQERFDELGSYAKLARRLKVNPDNLSRRVRGLDNSLIRRATIDQALEHWGDGTTFGDIYRELAA